MTVTLATALFAGDRVTFTSRHTGATYTGIVLAIHHYAGRDHAHVLTDVEPGRADTTWQIDPAELAPFPDSPKSHAAALLRAADWWGHHPTMALPETVTAAADPSCAPELAVFARACGIDPRADVCAVHRDGDSCDFGCKLLTPGGVL